MQSFLVAHCPSFGCYWHIPVMRLPTEKLPDLDTATAMIVVCPNCQKEFEELVSALVHSMTSIPPGRCRHRRIPEDQT